MNRIYKLILTVLTAVCLTMGPAMAFSGVSIGFVASTNDLDTYGSERDGDDCCFDDMSSTTKSATADVVSTFIEVTGGQGSTIGIEYYPGEQTLGTGSRSDTGAQGADSGTSTSTYTGKARVKDLITIYGEPTWMFSDYFGVYGKVGVTSMKVLTEESLDVGTDSSAYPNKTVMGGMYGLGVKAVSPFGLFLKAEATEHVIQKMRFISETGNGNIIKANLDITSVRFALGYNF